METAVTEARSPGTAVPTAADYALPLPAAAIPQARAWLWLGLLSLVLSGLFSLLIVFSRTPYLQDVFPFVDFFHTALVVHVDLSVLVWFVAFAGVLWSINGTRRCAGCAWAALVLAAAGALVMSAAPFVAPGNPLMSNYVPVLQQGVFLTGLAVFGVGLALLVVRAMFFAPPVGRWVSGEGALRFGLNTAVVAAAVALMAFVWTLAEAPDYLVGKEYFEVLFWGGGHVLQFTHTQLMLVVWLWLATAAGAAPRIGPRVVLFLFAWGLLAVFITPLIYLAYPVGSLPHRQLFTWQMEFGGSLATVLIGAGVLWGLLGAGRAPAAARPQRAALVSSMVLFGVGGVLGFMIQGSNVTVPAHYHGCIVGVTLAFMGMTYHLLPRLGYARAAPRAGAWQAYIYGAGQLMHVIGLAWSGGYGVQRKTAGAAQGLDSLERIVSMGFMGLGGFISIIGGVLFLVLVFRAMTRRGAA